MDIISYKTPYTNNHILNTVLMKYCEAFFGRSELVLRLPNIMAFIVYSTFAIKLLHKYTKLVLPCYLLLILHPYLLEFFALARGYGLSMGFLMMSIYFMDRFFIVKKTSCLIYFNLAAFLAVLSNFSLLNYYAAALAAYNIIFYIQLKINSQENQNKYSFYSLNKINLTAVLISAMILYEPLRRISKKSLLDFGGKKGFFADTIRSSIDDLFYEMAASPLTLVIIQLCVVGVSFAVLLLICIRILKKDDVFVKNNHFLIFMNVTLFMIVLITQIQHFALGNDYYIHRFALFLYPLFVLNLIMLIYYLYMKHKTISLLLSYCLVGLLCLNFYQNCTLNYFKDWRYDKDTKMVMKKLIEEHEKNSTKNMQLGINWLFEPSTNFYRYIWDLNWMIPTHRKGIAGKEDYGYLFGKDPEYRGINTQEIIFRNELTDVFLLKIIK